MALHRKVVPVGGDVFAPVDDPPEGAAVVAALIEALAGGFELGLVTVDCLLRRRNLLRHEPAVEIDEVARPRAPE